MKSWLVLLTIGVCVSCNAPAITNPTQAVTAEAIPPPVILATPTPDCLPVPGVLIELQRISDTSIGLTVTGLQLGEKPQLFYGARGGYSTMRLGWKILREGFVTRLNFVAHEFTSSGVDDLSDKEKVSLA